SYGGRTVKHRFEIVDSCRLIMGLDLIKNLNLIFSRKKKSLTSFQSSL
ncbi:hypothetical protein A3Q56_08516, partial [Intoshia linei]